MAHWPGKALAAATARVESYAGVSRLLGPLFGGYLAERSFLACYSLAAAAGAANTLVYALGLRETLGSPRPKVDRAAGWALSHCV